MIKRQRYDLILSIYLSTRGFAYVLSEGAMNPLDWGYPEARGPYKNDKVLESVRSLVRRYLPDVLILEDTAHPSSHRSRRIQRLNTAIVEFVTESGVPVTFVSREQVREAFHIYGAVTKDEIAEVIEERWPVFVPYVPSTRMPWMSAQGRATLFDAIAQALTANTQFIDSGNVC
jgi:Holliday junction resolvasome RuvABC endonuclease subunit